jgi:hypothetical protein
MKSLIAAALLLALVFPAHAAPEDEWFLIYDLWFCDVHDCGEGQPPHEDFVYNQTFATREQCLAESRRPYRLAAAYKFAEDETIGKISSRCVRPAPAAALTATPAQWKDIHALYGAFSGCNNYVENPPPGYEIPEPEKLRYKKACDLSAKLQDRLAKQGFCTYKHIEVGKLAWHGPEQDRVQLWPEGEKQCYALHEPTR